MIVFSYAGDLWITEDQSSGARRLTSFPGVESEPHFSPDGKSIAFAAEYDGNVDVYTVAVSGGIPTRLTWHPGDDRPIGWTPKGDKIIFTSGRTRAPIGIPDQLWTVTPGGNFPECFVLPRAVDGEISPDGKKMAYEMILRWESEFRNYRGGQNNPIRIVDLETLKTTDLPWNNSDDRSPVWLGEDIYFLSDRDKLKNIWKYNVPAGTLSQVTHYTDFDIKSVATDGKRLIFDKGGFLFTMAPGESAQKQTILVQGDFPWMRPHWIDAGKSINNMALSPSGKRAVFETHGEVLTVPAEKGSPRNLTASPGSAERSPAWSPDGQWISYFSDESGEYQLIISDQYGKKNKSITIPGATFFYTPQWSPDSKHISFGDADRNLWVVTISSGTAKKVDNEGFAHPERIIYPEWSPDSKYIAYAKRLESEYAAIFAYSMDAGTRIQITDGLAYNTNPAWDKSGKYLYFLGSTDYGLNVGWLDMSSYAPRINNSVYMAVLDPMEKSPLLVESDEESSKAETADDTDSKKVKKKKEEDTKDAPPSFKVDFTNIGTRIIALPLDPANYQMLEAGPEGIIFVGEYRENEPGMVLHKFVVADKEATEAAMGIDVFMFSSDGQKILFQMNGEFGIADASGKLDLGEQKIQTSELKVYVDPQQEYHQIFKEAVRYQRDYFYVENVHGLDLEWVQNNYGPMVDHVRHRDDLNFLLDILGGETAVGHSFVGGGDYPDVDRVPVGLLGADIKHTGEGYQITKIYTGESWNPDISAPLSGPGIQAREGDYIVTVNGMTISPDRNFYSYFAQTAGKIIRLGVASKPGVADRIMDVKPVSDDSQLRQYAWIEANRKKVDELSGGKLGYVWLPNTAFGGYTNFNRYYFAQKHKKGMIVDERFNGGGSAADYIIDLLSRDLMGYFNNPVGDKQPFTSPAAALFGPKVMIINEMAGSGGDYLPYMFKKKNIGPLVGTTTWGGLVGIWDVPGLIDGGSITAPRGGFFDAEGNWAVENEGVAPDYPVMQAPALVAEGKDPQLLKAIEVGMKLLETQEIKLKAQPADPVRSVRPSSESGDE
jgi:tricorn protease